MARKTATITIPGGKRFERDTGKTFVITEMSALRGERWANRAFASLVNSLHVDASVLDEEEANKVDGFARMAAMGINALKGINYDALEPLLEELMDCVKYAPDPNQPLTMRKPLDETGDIEEVATRWLLKERAFDLHTGFSIAGWWSKFQSALTTALPMASSAPPTSPAPSPPS